MSASTHKERHSGCLLDMPSGCKLLVDEVLGSPSDRSRLYSLGILPGAELEVCQGSEGSDSVHVKVRQSSLVLGQSMAEGIRCCAADERPCLCEREENHRFGRRRRQRGCS